MSSCSWQVPGPAKAMERAVATGDFGGALEEFHNGLDAAVRQLPQVELLAAAAAARLGDWQQATTLGLSVLEHSRVADDAGGRMRALGLLGALAFERGSHDDARAQLLEALELARRLEDRHVGPRILNNLASVAHVQGRVPEALERYHEAITMYQADENDRGLAETYHNIGLVQRQEKAWSEARVALGHAMRHALVVAEASLLALMHMGSAELYLDVGDFQQAQAEIDVADQLLAGVRDRLGEAELERLRALLELEQGNQESAHRHASAGEAVAAAGGSPLLESECAAVGASALQSLGADEAQTKHDRVVETMKALGASQPLKRFERQWAGVR